MRMRAAFLFFLCAIVAAALSDTVHSTEAQASTSGVKITALHYYGREGLLDEAIRLTNTSGQTVTLDGRWTLSVPYGTGVRTASFPLGGVALGPVDNLWITRDGAAFARQFGMSATLTFGELSGGSVTFGNSGGWVKLARDGVVEDAVVYGSGVWPGGGGWSGGGVSAYVVSGEIGAAGQVLERRGWEDTDGASDWRNANGQAVYPGWELERFEGGVRVSVGMTVALAPEGSWELASEALRGARESVELETYTLDHAGIGEVLVERASAGVRVRVLLDGNPVGGLAEETKWVCEKLEAAGGECWFMRGKEGEKIAKRYRHLHAKFAVIDGERVVIGSENYGKRGMPDDEKGDGTAGHRGVVGMVESREAAAWVRAVWEADRGGPGGLAADVVRWCAGVECEFGPAAAGYEPVRESGGVSYTVREPARVAVEGVEAVLATSPEGHLSVPGGVLEWIGRAGPGDEILVQQLREALAWGSNAAPRENPRLRALIEAAERGAEVRIMLDGGYDLSGVNAAVVAVLQELGLPNLRAMTANPTGLGIHNKMMLLRVGSNHIVHFGSWNGSETSALMNREVSITALAPAVHAFLRSAFLADWRGVQPTHLPIVMQEARYEPNLLISELMIDPIGVDLGGEWIEIYNAGFGMAQLSGVRLGDAFTEAEFGPGDGQVEFPPGATLPGGAVIVIAQDAVAFRERYGRSPDYEIAGYDEAVPDMLPVLPVGENGGMPGVVNLSNAGDAVALSADMNRILDIVAWHVGDIEKLRSFDQPIVSGVSLQRWPANRDTEDCATDFRLQRIPSPGRVP